MELNGKKPSNQEVGPVTSASEDTSWLLMFEYFPGGQVSDSDRD